MPSADIERRVADYYTGKLREHGATHSGVDWNSSESQLLRFEQFMRIMPRDDHVSVLDYGCGYGALAHYLEAAGVDFDYTGYDVSGEMVARRARAAADGPGGRSRPSATRSSPADFTLASGVFNVRVGTDEERWREYTLETIAELAALSRRGLGFNMLTSYSDPERMTERLYYGDPGFYFDWCKRNVSRNVALLPRLRALRVHAARVPLDDVLAPGRLARAVLRALLDLAVDDEQRAALDLLEDLADVEARDPGAGDDEAAGEQHDHRDAGPAGVGGAGRRGRR